MSATDPNPNVEPEVTGQEAWFNKDVRVFEDLYVYGNLYYNFEGTDILDLDQLNVTGIATFNNVDLTNLNVRNIFSTGIVTFPEIDNLQVGILTVSEFFRVKNGESEYVTIPATGSRAGRVGIGSTLPDQKLDIGGSIHIDKQIFDSDNAQGNPGNYLGKDEGGIRWVLAPPFAQVDGFFARNEGINIGINSFSTINLIGDRSGGDIVFGSINAIDNQVLDVDIRSRWVKNNSGIHTISNIGIGSVTPTSKLDIYESSGDGVRIRAGDEIADVALSVGSAEIPDKFVVQAGGSVGIGSLIPQAKLDIYRDDSTNSGTVQITQNGSGDASIDFQIKGIREYTLGIDNSDSDKFKLSTTAGLGSDDVISITSSGRVIIGHTSTDAQIRTQFNTNTQIYGAANNTGVKIATYSNDDKFKHGSAVGFIDIYSLPSRIQRKQQAHDELTD